MTSIDAIVNRQLLRWEHRRREDEETPEQPSAPARAVTVSRQAGSRGAFFAGLLADRLGFQRLHREAIDHICQSSGYRRRIIEALDGRFRSDLENLAESFIIGQSIDHSDYYRHLFPVALSMARLGGVVLVGRGGNFILGPMRGFHVRVIAPIEQRISNLVRFKRVSEKAAREEIRKTDAERRDLIQKLFRADIDDPHQYDLVINTSFIEVEEMVDPVITAIEAKIRRLAAFQTQTAAS